MTLKYQDIVNIQENCLLVVGRHLNIKASEADVANVIVYKKNDTLYLIDTGVVEAFGQTVKEACQRLEPYDRVVLINSHGHGDHVGNNTLIESLNAKIKEHYISIHDLEMMRDNFSFFIEDFSQVEPYFDGRTAHEQLTGMLALFMPQHVETPYTNTLETLPCEDIKIGAIHWSGWNFNNHVYVLKSQGHSRGHVLVYIPEIKHMHMGDETNGYCNLFHDCDHLKSLESHTKTLSLLESLDVSTVTDGHTFEIFNNREAIHWLNRLINGHYVFTNFIRELFQKHQDGLLLDEIYEQLTKSDLIKSLPAGANPNPVYSRLQILSKFRDLGITGDSKNIHKARFRFLR